MKNDGLRLHPRMILVQQAEAEMALVVLKVVEDRDLSPIETVRALLSIAMSQSKYVLRAERHPRSPSKRADEA